MQTKIEKLPKSEIKLNIIVEQVDVKKTYDEILNKAALETEVDGFRKGNAPLEKVEQKLGTPKLYGDTIDELLQKYYTQAIKENLIMPISNPKVEIAQFDLQKDFEFTANVAVKPEIKINDYKKELKKYYEQKNQAIHKENEEKLKKGDKIEHDHAHIHPNEVVEVLIKNAELEISGILVDEETNRLISRLVNEVMAAGMKMEDYMKAQNTTIEKITENYKKVAEMNLKGELILHELIKLENITVDETEIDKTINAVENEENRKALDTPFQRVYIRTILEKNALFDKIIKNLEGENNHE